MYYSPNQWLLFFFIYCFFGWVWETLYVSAKSHELVNRGFLHGPFLPIYGSGAIVILLSTIGVRDNLLLIYLFGLVSSTILEYFTGAAMEKLFGVRYWDYSKNRFNLNGHICLFVSLAWGVFAMILVRVVHPPIENLVLLIPENVVDISAIVLTLAVAVDTTVSAGEALDLKATLENLADSNEEIRKLQSRADFILALAEEDLHNFVEEREERTARFMDRFEANLQAARARRLAKLDRIADEAKAFYENAEENHEKLSEYLDILAEQRSKLRERTDRSYRRSSKILRRNPGAVSKRYRAELDEILELLKK